MNITMIIIGVLLFAAATAFLYVWGLKKQMNKTQDLLNLLFSNGVSRVNKYMKKHDMVTKEEVIDLVDGLSAKLPFSADKSVVTDPEDFADQLLKYMVKTGQLEIDNKQYRKTKHR